VDSILDSVKKVLGISTEDDSFETDIIIAINSAFMILSQLGVSQNGSFSITDNTATWSDFLGSATDLEAVKSYVCLKVQLLFDPPTSSFVLDAKKNIISELEFRLQLQSESVVPVAADDEEE